MSGAVAGPITSIPLAVTAVTNSKMQAWQSMRVKTDQYKHGGWGQADCTDQVNNAFIKVLPLLSGANDLSLQLLGLSIDSVRVYVDMKAAQQQGIGLRLARRCKGSLTDLVQLVSRMPAGSKLVLDELEADEHMLTELCYAVTHSVELHVRLTKLNVGYEQRIQAALLQRGDLGVTLEAYDESRAGRYVRYTVAGGSRCRLQLPATETYQGGGKVFVFG